MGTNQKWLQTVDATQVAYLAQAFEDLNRVSISITMSPVETASGTDFYLSASAFTRADVSADRALSACVNSTFRALNCQTMDNAIIGLLYRLDDEIARRERDLPKPE